MWDSQLHVRTLCLITCPDLLVKVQRNGRSINTPLTWVQGNHGATVCLFQSTLKVAWKKWGIWTFKSDTWFFFSIYHLSICFLGSAELLTISFYTGSSITKDNDISHKKCFFFIQHEKWTGGRQTLHFFFTDEHRWWLIKEWNIKCAFFVCCPFSGKEII